MRAGDFFFAGDFLAVGFFAGLFAFEAGFFFAGLRRGVAWRRGDGAAVDAIDATSLTPGSHDFLAGFLAAGFAAGFRAAGFAT